MSCCFPLMVHQGRNKCVKTSGVSEKQDRGHHKTTGSPFSLDLSPSGRTRISNPSLPCLLQHSRPPLPLALCHQPPPFTTDPARLPLLAEGIYTESVHTLLFGIKTFHNLAFSPNPLATPGCSSCAVMPVELVSISRQAGPFQCCALASFLLRSAYTFPQCSCHFALNCYFS